MYLEKPNLFIVGAARSGTTSLWRQLKTHPRVFIPADPVYKEPAFFSDLKRSRFKTLDRYMEIFAEAGENQRWLGEASTAYLTDPESARRIYDFNPRARIVIILRNPVSRAYSLYNWMVQEGYEYAETFDEALRLEKKRISKEIPNYFEPEYYYNYLYFNSGLYYEQVKRYLDLFGENVLLLKFEEYIKDTAAGWRKVCGFLDIEPEGMHKKSEDKPANESKQVYSPVVQFILRKITKYYLSQIPIENSDNRAVTAAAADSIPDRDDPGTCYFKTSSRGIGKKKSAVQNVVFDRMKKELVALSAEKKIGPLSKIKIYYLLDKIAAKLSRQALFLNKDTKKARDSLISLGQREKRSLKIKSSTLKNLDKAYRPHIEKFADFLGPAGRDFCKGWYIGAGGGKVVQ